MFERTFDKGNPPTIGRRCWRRRPLLFLGVRCFSSATAGGATVMTGAPNLIRGDSHSGNVAAQEVAEAGLLGIVSSDDVPASLLMGAFQLPKRVPGIDLSAAITTVTANPARAAGLDDRGRIAPDLRADLVRVRMAQGVPVVREVRRAGARMV